MPGGHSIGAEEAFPLSVQTRYCGVVKTDDPSTERVDAERGDCIRSLPLSTLLRAARNRAGGDATGCEVLFDVMAADRHLRAHLHRVMEGRGLSEFKFATLVSLFALDPMMPTSADLASYADVSRSAMTEILDQLEERRWIVRHRRDEDRRIIQIEITEQGRQATSEAIKLFIEAADHLTRTFTPQLKQSFRTACAKLTAQATAAPSH